MRDDERYPIAVHPEGIGFIPEEKICTPIEGPDARQFPGYPPAYNYSNTNGVRFGQTDAESHRTQIDIYGKEAQLQERPYHQPWWRRRTVLILFGLILVVVLVAIGGIIYATKQSNKKKDNVVKVEPFTFDNVQNSTLNSVASSGLFLNDGITWSMQTYWQTPTGSIEMQRSLDGETWIPAQNITLPIAPRTRSPITATASTDTQGVVYLTLFYMSNASEIVMAGHACAAGSSSCSITTNKVVSNNLSIPLNNDTDLAAVTVNDAQDWRVYYQDQSGSISELMGNAAGFGTGSIIGGAGLNASSMAAVNIDSSTNNINVFFVDGTTKKLSTLQFVDGAWTLPQVVSSEQAGFYNPLSGLSACYSSIPDQIHVYYTGLDRNIYEFTSNKASTVSPEWVPQPITNSTWATADYIGADVTAVGWDDQVRFFQMNEGKVFERILSNTTWTEAPLGQ
ncbi:hypothetical protein PVAG01_00274 [Phlyctema vagabunda]|uniref:Fucose-specific lectin n=1 Tax=Phlyctema vagabunda TaxID=108571 RepID=A0ABR4PTU4_9HELO